MRYLSLICICLIGCSREKPLPVMGEVPAFELVNQQGEKFTRANLDGHIWIADFVYTHCEGPCPRMSSHMRTLQDKTGPAVRLISFTVDPTHDTSEVLAAYGKLFGANAAKWSLLTGSTETLNTLDHDAFKLGSVGGPEIDHSTYFVIVDKKGQIRGYYGIAAGNPVDKIAKDVERLEKDEG